MCERIGEAIDSGHCNGDKSQKMPFQDLGKLPEFLTAFDIVIADEQGLNLSMRMIEEIVATKTRGTSGEKAIEK